MYTVGLQKGFSSPFSLGAPQIATAKFLLPSNPRSSTSVYFTLLRGGSVDISSVSGGEGISQVYQISHQINELVVCVIRRVYLIDLKVLLCIQIMIWEDQL